MAAPFVYIEATRQMSLGLLNFTDDVSIDIRSMLVATDSTCPTLDTANVLTDFTLDIYANSSRYDHAVVSQTEQNANDRTEIDLDDAVFTNLAGPQVRPCIGMLTWWDKGSDATSIPLFFWNLASFDGNGSTVTIQFDAQGAMQITSAGA